MGNWSSGNYAFIKPPIVEGCLFLSTDQLRRAGLLGEEEYCEDVLPLRAVETGEGYTSLFAATFRLEEGDRALYVQFRDPWAEEHPRRLVENLVSFDTSVPTYGGLRWWFLCPKKMDGRPCRRRVRKLYLPPWETVLGCRHCYGLSYASAQGGKAKRALRAARKIRLHLGGSLCLVDPFPPKPPRMHWRTYETLQDKAARARWRYLHRGRV